MRIEIIELIIIPLSSLFKSQDTFPDEPHACEVQDDEPHACEAQESRHVPDEPHACEVLASHSLMGVYYTPTVNPLQITHPLSILSQLKVVKLPVPSFAILHAPCPTGQLQGQLSTCDNLSKQPKEHSELFKNLCLPLCLPLHPRRPLASCHQLLSSPLQRFDLLRHGI